MRARHAVDLEAHAGVTLNVKAQGLLHGAAWVRQHHGAEGLERVLAQCSPGVRERCTSAIAINWIAWDELAEFLTNCDSILGRGNGKVAEAMGAASARINLRTMGLRLAFFLVRPEFLMRRVAGVWRQYNDHGEMVVREFDDDQMLAELILIPKTSACVCHSITGWLYEAGAATGMKNLGAQHLECRARHDARCIWQLRWGAQRSMPPPR